MDTSFQPRNLRGEGCCIRLIPKGKPKYRPRKLRGGFIRRQSRKIHHATRPAQMVLSEWQQERLKPFPGSGIKIFALAVTRTIKPDQGNEMVRAAAVVWARNRFPLLRSETQALQAVPE